MKPLRTLRKGLAYGLLALASPFYVTVLAIISVADLVYPDHTRIDL